MCSGEGAHEHSNANHAILHRLSVIRQEHTNFMLIVTWSSLSLRHLCLNWILDLGIWASVFSVTRGGGEYKKQEMFHCDEDTFPYFLSSSGFMNIADTVTQTFFPGHEKDINYDLDSYSVSINSPHSTKIAHLS